MNKIIRMRGNRTSTFGLQVTSMVDMFTIILVFLLKSYSTSAVQITPQEGLKLPTSTSNTEPVEALKLVVSQEGVFVKDEQILVFKKGKPDQADLDSNDSKFLRPLYEALNKEAENSKKIADLNDAVEFDGRVVVQADHKLPYSVLKKVMYTSMLAGYADVKMAVLALE